MLRLQGEEWHKVKDSFILKEISISDNFNVCGIYENKITKVNIRHWLNNEEVVRLLSYVLNNYNILDFNKVKKNE